VKRPLWRCSKCRRRFANRNQTHVRAPLVRVTPRRQWLDGHIVLARRFEPSRFRRIETFSPRNHVHHFRLNALTDIDEDFDIWLREAYAVGQQRHLQVPIGQGRNEKST
jgi:hypothetical protein